MQRTADLEVLQSLVSEFVYTDKQARALSVVARATIESLRNIYDAGELVDELLGRAAR